MVVAAGSMSRIASKIARTLPELPTACCQPTARNAVCIGSSSTSQATMARSRRLADTRPSGKCSSDSPTQPMYRLSSTRGS